MHWGVQICEMELWWNRVGLSSIQDAESLQTIMLCRSEVVCHENHQVDSRKLGTVKVAERIRDAMDVSKKRLDKGRKNTVKGGRKHFFSVRASWNGESAGRVREWLYLLGKSFLHSLQPYISPISRAHIQLLLMILPALFNRPIVSPQYLYLQLPTLINNHCNYNPPTFLICFLSSQSCIMNLLSTFVCTQRTAVAGLQKKTNPDTPSYVLSLAGLV